MDEIDPQIPNDRQAPKPAPPRGLNIGAVAGGVVLIGLLAFALYRRSAPVPTGETPAPAPEAAKTEPARTEAAKTAAAPGEAPAGGGVIAQIVPFRLSPEASVVAERYRCICGCNELLNVCTCSKSPGSNEMKSFLQKLVDQKQASRAIDKAMIEKWGPQAVISTAPAPPAPAPPKR